MVWLCEDRENCPFANSHKTSRIPGGFSQAPRQSGLQLQEGLWTCLSWISKNWQHQFASFFVFGQVSSALISLLLVGQAVRMSEVSFLKKWSTHPPHNPHPSLPFIFQPTWCLAPPDSPQSGFRSGLPAATMPLSPRSPVQHSTLTPNLRLRHSPSPSSLPGLSSSIFLAGSFCSTTPSKTDSSEPSPPLPSLSIHHEVTQSLPV